MNNKIKEYVLWCDMDGCVANWQGRLEEILGEGYTDAHKGRKWAAITRYDKEVAPFYATLPKFEDTDVLWEFIVSTFEFYSILSACGNTPHDASIQKRTWVHNNLGKDVNIVIVKRGVDKAIYAHPKAILIDDRAKVIDPWNAAGGLGILHVNAADTIKQLKEILKI